MSDMPLADPETYYDEYGHREWERLERSLHGRLEWEGTVDVLEEELPDDGRVLDAGGAAGRYTVWLAERGHDVKLVDLSAEQLSIAREKVAERGLEDRVSIEQGDIRDLALPDDAFDATLCLGGPLSHVTDADEREQAVNELRRVTKPGQPVFVSVMGLLNLLGIMLAGRNKITILPDLAQTGDYTPEQVANADVDSDFTSTHFFRRAEFEELMGSGGLDVEQVIGLEGVASGYAEEQLRETTDELSADERAAIRELVEYYRTDSTVTDLSAHMLALGKA